MNLDERQIREAIEKRGRWSDSIVRGWPNEDLWYEYQNHVLDMCPALLQLALDGLAAKKIREALENFIDGECHCDEPGVIKPCVQCIARAALHPSPAQQATDTKTT